MDLHSVDTLHRPSSRTDIGPLDGADAILAGGTWLLSEPQPAVRRLVDITTLNWPAVSIDDDGLTLAATATIEEVSELSRTLSARRPDWQAAPLFHQCCTALLASFKIWHTATVGGNICLSFPAGAMISLVAGLDGTVLIWRPDGTDYRLPITEFVTGAAQNAMAAGEILREVTIPATALRGRTAYRKLAPSPLGRSGIVVTGRVDSPSDRGSFTVSITAATVRPYVFTFPGVPSAAKLRQAHGTIPDDAYTRDAHGDPDWRQAVSLLLAEQIRAELG